jgi:vacuolar protein sorting-associated protein 54
LTTIPTVYFDDDFHLENPRTFDVVSERSEVVRPAPGSAEEKRQNGNAAAPRKALATNAILQEKLSWYMDTIEVHLISAISTASSSFFAALGELRELHSEAADSVARIKQLRQELDALDKEMALGGLEIVNMRQRSENMRQLSAAVQQLKSVVEAVGKCESYVENGDVEKALDAMDSLQSLIKGEMTLADSKVLDIPQIEPLRDLSAATALQSVDSDMKILRSRIGQVYQSRFMESLLGDLRRHIDTANPGETLQRWNNASQRARGKHNRDQSTFPSYLTVSPEFRAQILSHLNGLHRSSYLSYASAAYRDAVLHEVKAIIKRPLPSSNDDDTDSIMSMSTAGGNRPRTQQDRATILARNLRSLDPEDAEEMLTKIYIGIGESLRRLGTQVKVLLDVTSTFGGSNPGSPSRSPPRSPEPSSIDGRLDAVASGRKRAVSVSQQMQDELHQTLDMSSLLGQAVDIAQTQVVKVLNVRREQSAKLPPTRFLRYFTLNLLFANECEAVSGRSGTKLKNVVNGQIKDFLREFGSFQQAELAAGMDKDLWVAKDFTEQDATHLERILQAADKDPEPWSAGTQVWKPYSEVAEPTPTTNGTAESTSGSKEKVRPATIEAESFILPSSAVIALRGIPSYLELITVIPSLAPDISSLLLSYLQLFNSRCTQLILGAGATKIAGLKHITGKHLALASRALAFITSLIPYIREFIRRHVGTGPGAAGVIQQFDAVRRAYQEHQGSIADKLVEIMGARTASHVKNLRLIEWDDPAGEGPNAYVEGLTKELGTLQRVLAKHLGEGEERLVIGQVLNGIKEHLGGALAEAEVATEGGKSRYVILLSCSIVGIILTNNRMLRDVEYFQSKMAKIDSTSDVPEYLFNIVNEKKLPVKEEPQVEVPPVVEEKKEEPQLPEPPLPALPDEAKEDEKKAEDIKEAEKEVEAAAALSLDGAVDIEGSSSPDSETVFPVPIAEPQAADIVEKTKESEVVAESADKIDEETKPKENELESKSEDSGEEKKDEEQKKE